MAREQTAAFMCAEKLPWRCHRRFIAEALAKRGWRVLHILEGGRVWDPELALLRPRSRPAREKAERALEEGRSQREDTALICRLMGVGGGMAQTIEAMGERVRGKLSERFRVESVLAERECFSRYLAWDEDAGARRLIEIQQVRPEDVAIWSARASLARRLQHPALLACLEAAWLEPQHGLLVLEEPPAGAPPDRPALNQILEVGVTLSSALALLHAVGLRFGAPMVDPVFWQGEGREARIRVELLGRAVAGFRREPICANALRFVPPEIVSGEPTSPAGDLFILGCLLQKLWRGEPPHPDGLASLEAAEPGVGEEIVRLLKREAADRPASAAEVCRSFVGLLLRRGIEGEPPPSFGRVLTEGHGSDAAALAREYVVPVLSRAMVEKLVATEPIPSRLAGRLNEAIWSGEPPSQERAGETERFAQALQANHLWRSGRSEEALAQIDGLSDTAAVALRATIARERGRLDRCEEILSSAEGCCARLLIERGELRVAMGRPAEAICLLQEAAACAADPTLGALARGLVGRTLARLGRLREASDEIQQAADLLEGTEPAPELPPIRLFRAEVDYCAGRWDTARRALSADLEIACRGGDRSVEQRALLLLAEVELALGQEVSASERIERALTLASAREDIEAKARALGLRLAVHAAQGDWEGVISRARAVLRPPVLAVFRWERVRFLLLLARAALETGQAKTLTQALREARQLLADLRDPVLQSVLRSTEALALARSGELSRAAQAFENSLEPLESMSLAYAQARLYTDFVSEAAFARFPDTVRLRREAAERIARELGAASLLRRLESVGRLPLSSATIRIPGLVASSEPMIRALAQAMRVSGFDVAVHLAGESGTGKELVARAIHAQSERRARGKFVALNCAALPDSLLEAELFGHARGAFTGAERARAGLLEEAHGGTLFLDEVADLSPRGQTLLLRVLQEKEYRRLGESEPRRSDFRVISATRKRLEEEVAAGRFREDLFFRLKVVGIDLPPLRERVEDILPLARSALSRKASELGLPAPRLSREVERALLGYSWPGNVRELENEMVQALLRLGSADTVVAFAHLSPHLGGVKAAAPLRSACSELERRLLEEALARHEGNRSRTARELGLTRQALYMKMRRYGLGPGRRGALLAQVSMGARPIRSSCSSLGSFATRHLSG